MDKAGGCAVANEDILLRLYGREGLERAKQRCETVKSGFEKTFGQQPEALFRAPGRTELGGNHTDHQHGHVLAASLDLDILAAVRPNNSGRIRIFSEGHGEITADLSRTEPDPNEYNTSSSLVRGLAALSGSPAGFDAYMVSDVPPGSGMSSSAAFEVLIGTILNELFLGSRYNSVEIAQLGQLAENRFFGKPCGLMDQAA
ncbi:MAG: galactokinase, partial [Eubacterium sp.]|nr:galactokinase [Eubacterium sp.]